MGIRSNAVVVLVVAATVATCFNVSAGAEAPGNGPKSVDLWSLAKGRQDTHRFSTLFTAQQVRDHLATDQGIDAAIRWCKKTAMIDDFWFTDCTCRECDAARQARRVTIGRQTHPVAGDTWEDYRCELMVRLSRERILGPAKRVNPKVKLIIKYPQWYDRFHERGYEVVRETADFDRISVGTIHAAKDPELCKKLAALFASGKPVLITDGLAERLKGHVSLPAANVYVLPVQGKPKSLLELPPGDLDAIRRPLLRPLGRSFQAPNRVALYLFEDGSWVIENFNDKPVTVELDGKPLQVAARGWLCRWKQRFADR